MNDLQAQYDALVQKNKELVEENERLKSILRQHGIEPVQEGKIEKPQYSAKTFPKISLSLEEKVLLFRSIFKGREDVYARRWYSRTTEKSGYQPVCINEWRIGICDKRKYKCAECPHRNFSALSDQDIYRHLEGKEENGCDVIGLYAVRSDNSCTFLCTDFDDKLCEHGYKNDVLSFVEVCSDWKIPYSMERSRSGNGAHVWIFFESPLQARKARLLGNAILTEAMNRNGRVSFSSYDRFFPNQDALPSGGFGNLIALPLQGKARKQLNSVFVDEEFLPFKDQWAYLHQIKRIKEEKIDIIIQQHRCEEFNNLTTSSESKPWSPPVPLYITASDFNPTIEITRANLLYIPLQACSAQAINHLKRIAAFKNPEFYSKQAMRLSTFSIPRIISCAEISDDYLALPRGCEEELVKLFNSYNVKYNITDKTYHGLPIAVTFKGQEREEQTQAINALLPHTCGILSATTAFGKTVTAAAIIARRKINTLILVHSKALLEQWHERLDAFLEIEYEEPEQPQKRGRKKKFSPIGCYDSTDHSLHGIIDIALIQSCINNNDIHSFVQDYGMVIVDECHHVSSYTFEQVLKSVKAQYVYGLTATPIRKDGHQPIIFMQCGPIRFTADAKRQIAQQSFHRFLIPRFTSFRPLTEDKLSFSSLVEKISEDDLRNEMIVHDVCHAINIGRTPIVITSRTSHATHLYEQLKQQIKNVILLTGAGTNKTKRTALEVLEKIPKNEPLTIVATGKYIGEGFDYPRLDTLFLALPISWKGLVMQYAGRLHREYEGKKDVRIYDYIDFHEPVCESMYRKRMKGYASVGYKIITKGEPTLFDDITNELSLFSKEEQIFDGKTFYAPLSKDMNTAKGSIILSSPRLYAVATNKTLALLKALSSKGLEIVIFTKEKNEEVKKLENQGLQVNINPTLTLCCTIIDKSMVWYGSINILGFVSQEDNIIKITDTSLANEMIGELYK